MTNCMTIVACTLLIIGGVAHAQGPTASQEAWTAQEDTQSEPTQAAVTEPTGLPPAPPLLPPPPPQAQAQAQAEEEETPAPPSDGTEASGQWVYTDQYGWVFVPYGDQYVSPAAGFDETALCYVYQPGTGWVWLAAPWTQEPEAYPFLGIVEPVQVGWHHGHSHGDGHGDQRGNDQRGNGPRGNGQRGNGQRGNGENGTIGGGHAGPPRMARPGPVRDPRNIPTRPAPSGTAAGHAMGAAPSVRGNPGRAQPGASAGSQSREHR